MTRAAVLAVDGGNSKADVALVAVDGTLLAAVHGPSISHQAVGLRPGMATLVRLAREAAAGPTAGSAAPGSAAAGSAAPGSAGAASGPVEHQIADLGVYGLAGADYPEDVRLLQRSIEELGLSESTVVLNDTFAALRAGTHRPWGVVLICGHGINAGAVAPDGRSARFDSVGSYSGDWGGGAHVGQEGLNAAVRAADGRGPATSLRQSVPAHFGLRSPAALTKALYFGRVDAQRVEELSLVVFRAAGEGDAVARSIIDRLADELAGMARALIRRLRLSRLDPDVVLAGGVFRTDDVPFLERLEAGVLAATPRATIHRLEAPPVLGAALIGLDRLSPTAATPPATEARLRSALEAWSAR